MADRYWVGGTGTWDTTSTTNWSATSGGSSGASRPAATDNVFFDQVATYTVTMTGALTCLNITVSAGTVSFLTGTAPTLAVSGSLSLVAGTVWNSTGTVTLNSTTTGRNITTNGTTINGAVTFNGVGGAWTLGSALTTGVTLTTTLTNGSLTLNGFNLTTGVFSSSSINTRSIAFGTGNIVLSHTTAATTVLSMATVTGFTRTGTGGFTADASVTRSFVFGTTGGTTSNAPNLTFTTGASIASFFSGSWFNTLDFGTTSFNPGTTTLNLNALTLSSTGTYTALSPTMRGTGTITSNGKTIAAFGVNSAGTTTLTDALSVTTYTQTAGTIDFATFNLTCSGAVAYTAGTLSNIGTITCTTWTVTGTFTLTQGIITPSTSFVLTSGAFNYNGGTLSAVPTFTHTAGTVTLGQSYALAATGTYTLTAGTLSLAGFTLTTGIFASTNTNTRSIAFSTGNIVLSHTTAAQTVLSMAIATGFTNTGTGGFTADLSITRTFTFGTTGGSATNAPNLALTLGAAIPTITTGSWFDLLDFTGTTCTPATTTVNVNTLTLATGGTYTSLTPAFTATQTWTPQFSKQLGGFGVNGTGITVTLGGTQSIVATGTTTLTAGTLDLGGYDLTTGIFSSTNTNTRSIVFGTNNIVLSHTTAAQTVLSFATATGFTYTGTGGFTTDAAVTRTYVFGTTGGSATNAPNLSFTDSGTAVQTFTTASWFNTLNFGTTAFNPGTTALNLNGLTLSSGGTFTTLSATMRGTGTITPNGKTIAALTVNNGAGTVTLADALGVTTYTQTAGTIDFATFNLTCSGAVAYTAGTLNNIGTITCTTWTVTGAFTLSSGTITPSTSFVITSGSFTYSGGTLSPVPTFTHTAGTVTLGQNYSLTSTGTYTLTAGTLNMIDRNLTAAIFITSGIGVRAINFGTSGNGEITVIGNNATIWDGGGAGITYTGNPRIVATYTGAVGTRTVNLGTAWTEATAFDVTMQPGSSSNVYGFQIINGSTDIIAMSGVAENVSLSGFLFTFNPGVMTVYGDYTIDASGGTVSASASTTTFATTSSKNISISRSIDFPITFSGVGGTFNINDSLTTGATRAMTLTAGSLVLNGSSSISTGTFLSTGTSTRSINFNNNNITLTSTVAATTVLSMATATGFTIAGTGGFISDLGVTKTFSFGSTAGGATTNAPNLTFTTGAAVPTITTGSWFNSLNFGSTTSTPAATTVFVSTLTLASGGTYTGLTPTFTSTQTWTPQFSKQLAGLGVNISGGTLTLGGSQSLIATSTTTLTAGTLDLGGFDLTTGIFSSSNTNTRSIAFGLNNITLTHTTAAQVVLAMATATNFTFTDSGGGFVSDLTVTRTFQFGSTAGGATTNAPNLTFTTGASIATLTTASWFNALDFTGTTSTPAATTVFVSTLTLATGGTYTGLTPTFTSTQTWTPQFSKQLGGVGVNIPGGTLTLGGSQSLIATSTTTLTAGTLDLGGFDLTTGIFSSSNTNTRSIAFGANNIVLSHTTATTTVLSMATATGFTRTGTGGFTAGASVTRTYVFGTTGGSATIAPNLTFTTGASVATITNGSWFDKLDYGSTSFTPSVTTLNLNALTLSSSGNYANMFVTMVGTGTITSVGKPLAALTINSTGTVTLADSLSLFGNGLTTLTAGTLALAGFTLTTGIFSSTGTGTRAIAFGTGNIVLSHTTAATTVLSMATATGFTLTGTGGFTADASVTRTYVFGTTGGSVTNAPNLSITSGAAIPTITTNSWFNALDFTGTTSTPAATTVFVSTLTLATGGTYTAFTPIFTRTQTWTTQFSKQLGGIGFNLAGGTLTLGDSPSLVATGTTTLTNGTLDLGGFDLTTGIFSSSNTNTRSIAFGTNNIVLATTTVALTNLSMADATNFTFTSSGTYGSGTGGFQTTMSVTRTFTFGTTGGSTANAPRLYLVSGASIPTITTGSWLSEIDFGTTAFTIVATNLNLGSLKSNLSTSVLTALTATMVGTGSIRTNTSIGPLVINTSAITTTLVGTTLCTTAALTQGTLDLASNTLTCSSTFTYNGGSLLTASSILNCTTFTVNGPAFDFTTGTITPSTSFVLTSGSFTLNGGTLSAVPAFTHTAGTATFNTGYALTATGTYTLTAGTLSLPDGVTLSTGIFSSTNTNTRSIAFGATTAGYVSLTHTTAATTRLSMAIATGFTESGPGGFTSSMGVTATFTFGTTGGSSSNAPTLLITGGAAIPTFTTGSWFNLLDFTGSTSTPAATVLNLNALTLAVGGTYTALSATMVGTGSILSNGKTIAAFTINSTSGTTTLGDALALIATGTSTLTSGTLDLNGFDLTTGIFSSSVATARSVVFGTNNIVLAHTTLATTVLSMATATGFTYTGTGGFSTAMSVTRTFTFGTTGGSSSNAPNLSITSGASIPTFTTGSWFNLLDFTGNTSTPAATVLNLNGLTLASGGTYTALGATMRGTGTITPNGKTIAAFTVNNDTGTVTLAAALSVTTYTQTAGTIDFATFNLTCSGAAAYTSGTLNNIGTISCTTWTVTGTFTMTNGTITPSTSFVLTSGAFNYNGGTLSAVPTFTHTAGTVTLGQSYALTTTGTYTHTSGTLALAGFTLTTGIFISSNANTRAITFGTGNINLTHTTPASFVLSMDTLTNFTYTGTGGFTVADMSNTRTFNVGTTGGTTSNAPNLTFTTGASVATIVTGSYFGNLNFGTTSFNPGTTALNIAGDLTLSSSGTYTTLTPTMRGTGTITSNGKTIPALIVNTTGTATLADALTASGALTLTQGTLDCSTFSLASATFASTGALTRSMTGSGTYTVTGSGATAFSNASATGITMSGFTISMTNASAKTFAGGGGTYPTLNQGGSGALTISGNNSFADLTATTRPSTITFTISTTQTFTAFTLSGTAGNLVTINSSTASTQATLSKSSGTVSVDYLSIQDSNTAGGASWYAGVNSTNVSNNTGWIFTAPPGPSTNTGNFFLFFG